MNVVAECSQLNAQAGIRGNGNVGGSEGLGVWLNSDRDQLLVARAAQRHRHGACNNESTDPTEQKGCHRTNPSPFKAGILAFARSGEYPKTALVPRCDTRVLWSVRAT